MEGQLVLNNFCAQCEQPAAAAAAAAAGAAAATAITEKKGAVVRKMEHKADKEVVYISD